MSRKFQSLKSTKGGLVKYVGSYTEMWDKKLHKIQSYTGRGTKKNILYIFKILFDTEFL